MFLYSISVINVYIIRLTSSQNMCFSVRPFIQDIFLYSITDRHKRFIFLLKQKGSHMKNKPFRKFFSILLSVMMLTGNTQVYAEEEGTPEEGLSSEETVLTEEIPEENQEPAELSGEEAGEPEESVTFDGDIELPEVGDDEIIFNLPQEVQVPIWSDYIVQKGFSLINASLEDIEWEIISSEPNDMWLEMGTSGRYPKITSHGEGDAVVRATLRMDGVTISTMIMRVVVRSWYEGSSVSLEFSDSEPQDISLTVTGPVTGKDFTVTSGDENVAVVERLNTYDEDGRPLFRVTPKNPGSTKLYMTVEDPNNPGKTTSFSCQDITVFSEEPLESVSLSDPFAGGELSEATIEDDGMVVVQVDVLPETYNINNLEITVSDESLVTVERWDLNIYMISALGKAGTVTVTFGDGDVKASLTIHITGEEPSFILPESLVLPVWYEKEYELPITLSDGLDAGSINWSTDHDNIALIEENDGVLYVSTKEAGQAVITGILHSESGDITQQMTVTVAHWFEPSIPGMMFATPGDEAQSFELKAINAASGMNYEVFSADTGIAEVTFSGGGDTKTVTVDPAGPGITELYIMISDPNDPSRQMKNIFMDVVVCDPDAQPQSLRVLSLDDEPVTELHLQAGQDPYWVVVEIDPSYILPDRIEMQSTEPDVAWATHGPEDMSPYLFFIHAGQEAGEADIKFFIDDSDASHVIHVTVSKNEIFSFGKNNLVVPQWYEYPMDYVLDYPGATINDIEWGTDNGNAAAVEVHDGTPVLMAGDPQPVKVWGILRDNGEEVARCEISVNIVEWFKTDTWSLKFADKADEPKSIWLAPGDVIRERNLDYEFRTADEAIAVLEKTDNVNEEGWTEYIVRPVSAGMTEILITGQDPNDETKDLTVSCLGVQVCSATAKLTKIETTKTIVKEPNRRGVIWLALTPDTFDPEKISYSTSDDSVISINRNDEGDQTMYFYETHDKEGTATLTFSEGKIKATVKVTVTRFVSPDKDWTSLTYVEGAETQGSGEITVTLREFAAGIEPFIEVWNTGENEEDNFRLEEADWPFLVEKISENADKTQLTYRLTPVKDGKAQIHFCVSNEEKGDYTEGHVQVEVKGQEKLRWNQNLIDELNDPGRRWENNNEIHLNTENGDSPTIYYQVFYTKEDSEPAGLPKSAEELLASEQKLVYQNQFTIQSPYFGTGYMWIRAAAARQGWGTSDLLEVKLAVQNDELAALIDDDEFEQYIIDNGLSLADLKGRLHVFGIPEEVPYTGDKVTFDNIRVWYGTNRLGEGMDYKVAYANNTNPALSTAKKAPAVKITGTGEYTKTYTQKFSIVKMPLDKVNEYGADLLVTTTTTAFVTDAKTTSVTPKITVSLLSPAGKKTALKANTDYIIRYYPILGTDGSHGRYWENFSEPVDKIPAGETAMYRAVVIPKETSTKIAGFDMDPDTELFQDYIMKMPMIQVYFGDENNTYLNLSKATLTNQKLLNNLKFENSSTYDPYEVVKLFQEGKVQVKIGKQLLTPAVFGYEETPPQPGDYVIWVSNLKAGKNTLELVGMDIDTLSEGFQVVGSKTITFTIAPILNITAKTAVVSGLKTSVELNEHNYFQLFHEVEDEYGKRWEPDLSKLSKDGETIQLKDKKGNVIDPDNYDVYIDNYNGRLGSFKITFEGRPENGYTGKITKTVKIVAASLPALQEAGKVHISFRDMETPENTAQYSSSGAKPEIRVVVEMPWNPEHELAEGKDFTVTYTNNKKLGAEASVSITGKGFYKGKLPNVLTFTVVQADAGKMYDHRCPLTAAAADVIYNAKGKTNYFKSVPVLYDNGKALKKNKDYKILETQYWYGEDWYDEEGILRHSKDEPIPDGAKVPLGAVIHVGARVEILNSNYTFISDDEEQWIHMNYRMVAKAKKIASAKVKVNNGKAVYLGDNWNIVPPVTVTLGKVTLTDEDYEIIDIRNNWLIGTASMTIRGKGEYWGTKKITFKITKTPLQ